MVYVELDNYSDVVLQHHDGLESLSDPRRRRPGQADNEVYARSFTLKQKGERAKKEKKKEPTHRLRQHLFKGTKVSALQAP
eukprot:COSAG01_NODE_53224_length_340_cov_7.016598_2_plen_80_part_01